MTIINFNTITQHYGIVAFILIALAILLAWLKLSKSYTYIKSSKESKLTTSYSPRAAFLISLFSFFWPQFLVGFGLAVFLQIFNKQSLELSSSGKFLIQGLISGLSVASISFFLKKKGSKIKDLGLSTPKLSNILDVFGGYAIYILSFLSLSKVFYTLFPMVDPSQTQTTGYESASGLLMSIVVFIALVVIPPIAEEILFRGFLYSNLKRGAPKWLAAISTSFLFAAAHLQWNVGLDTFVLSLVLIYLYEKTGNLWVPIGLHALKNGLAFIVLFVLKT